MVSPNIPQSYTEIRATVYRNPSRDRQTHRHTDAGDHYTFGVVMPKALSTHQELATKPHRATLYFVASVHVDKPQRDAKRNRRKQIGYSPVCNIASPLESTICTVHCSIYSGLSAEPSRSILPVIVGDAKSADAARDSIAQRDAPTYRLRR